jgi:hypothetical protein
VLGEEGIEAGCSCGGELCGGHCGLRSEVERGGEVESARTVSREFECGVSSRVCGSGAEMMDDKRKSENE